MSKSYDKNDLTITDNSATITAMDYVDGSLVIDNGGKYSGVPTVAKDGKKFTITFYGDRHNSDSPAGVFNQRSGGAAHEYAAVKGSGGTPDQLNFCFTLRISFSTFDAATNSYISSSVQLQVGQGHASTSNNWWLGGGVVDSSKPVLTFPINGTATMLILPLSGSSDTYTFAAGSIGDYYPIKHVFVLMLENHSFDNMFAMSGIEGITAAATSNSNSYNGQSYAVKSGAPPSMPTDPGHEFMDVVEQLAGKSAAATYQKGQAYPSINNSGFASNYATSASEGPVPSSSDIGDVMACFDTRNQLPVLYQLATQYTLCDHWFSSLPGPTWPNRFFVHGASSNGLDHSPSTAEMIEWETGISVTNGISFTSGFSYTNGSIFQAMENDHTSYQLYNDFENTFANQTNRFWTGGEVPQVAALHGIDLTEVRSLVFNSHNPIHKSHNFASDLSSGKYTAQYTFIEPNYGDASGNFENGSSQHPMDGVYGGEGLIKYVYESIRNSPLWEESMLIITYDEHGGFYDSVAPGKVMPPNDNSSTSLNDFGFDFSTLGVRVPAVIVSPWVGKGVDTTKTVYDHSSVLATTEKLLGLKPLTQRDAQANNLLHLLLPTMRSAADCPTTLVEPAASLVAAYKTSAQYLNAFDKSEPLPERGYLMGILGILLKTEVEMSDGSDATKASLIAKFQQLKTRGDAQAYIQSVMAQVNAVKLKAAESTV